ncbi:hypothetical protein [Streptomyces sp. NPDC058145]|uniref:hypothetical protein n=1 Tax=Streptomyces sp. NPDC058145 TaxID=3346356 RepID=UPI0036EFC3DE
MNQPAGIQPKVSLAQSSPTVGTFRERDGALPPAAPSWAAGRRPPTPTTSWPSSAP